jgi:D-amino peptidase
MKLYLSVDLEGISGVVSSEQTGIRGSGYAQAQKLMIGEVNAAIEGALEGGATEICVNDSHGSMRNLLIEDLHPDAVLVTGSPKPLTQMQGIDSSFDLVGFVGYHARRDSMTAILEHTISGAVVRGITLNGRVVGEFGINTALAGYYNVPAGFLSGDNVVVQQACELVPNLVTAEVKVAQTRTSAKCLHPTKARELIKQKMTQAIQKVAQFKPYIIDSPVFEIEFINTGMAEWAGLLPSSERISATRLRIVHSDLLKAWKGLRAMITLATSTIST